jgi:hypothetical protein
MLKNHRFFQRNIKPAGPLTPGICLDIKYKKPLPELAEKFYKGGVQKNKKEGGVAFETLQRKSDCAIS